MRLQLYMSLVLLAVPLFASESLTKIDASTIRENIKTIAINSEILVVGTETKGFKVFDAVSHTEISTFKLGHKNRSTKLFTTLIQGNTIYIGTSIGLSVYSIDKEIITDHFTGKDLGLSSNKVYGMAIKNSELILGSDKAVSVFNIKRKKVVRVLKNSFLSSAALVLQSIGNQLLIGTSGSGLVVFNFATQKWSKFDQLDGLPSNVLNDITLYGSKAYIATNKGLAAYDFLEEDITTIADDINIISLALYNNTLYASSLGLLYTMQVPGSTMEKIVINEKEFTFIEKIIASEGGLVLATDGMGLLFRKEKQKSFAPLRIAYSQTGVLVKFKSDIFPSVSIDDFSCWYPDLPNAFFKSDNITKDSSNNSFSIALPPELAGNLVFEITVKHNSGAKALFTKELYRDKAPPTLELNPIPEFVNKPTLILSGSSQDTDLESIYLNPQHKVLKLNSSNEITLKLKLKPGKNNFTIDLEDRAGNTTKLPIEVTLDIVKPVIEIVNLSKVVNTHTISFNGIIKDANIGAIRIHPTDKAAITLVKNTFSVNLFNLNPGNNRFNIIATDKAGNVTQEKIVVKYINENEMKVNSVMSLKSDLKNIKEDKTEYTQKNKIQSIEITYIIQKNDTFRKLGSRFYGVSQMGELIAQYNSIDIYKEYKELRIGRKIKIPMYKDFNFGKLNADVELNRKIKGR